MKPLRVLVIDDEALARRRLVGMLPSHPDLVVVGEADAGSTAVAAIVDLRPDLIFLDVQMPGLDGFGVLRCTAGAHRPVVVFVTAHDEHAVRAFEVHAADYLLKPVSAPRLAEAVRRASLRARSEARVENAQGVDRVLAEMPPTPSTAARIPVRGAEGTELVAVAEITWVEADGDHAVLHGNGKARTLRETMTELESMLRPLGFVRVHRSAIVRASAVRSIEPIEKGNHTLVLVDGARVRTGRRYREAVGALRAGSPGDAFA